MRTKYRIGLLFIGLQLISVLYARFIPERFFCWAPYDSHTLFETTVIINDTTLTQAEAEKRYKYKMKGWEQRSIDNVFSIIHQYESTYGLQDQALVFVTYSTNGKSQEVWQFRP